jgi:hypothetical protein
MSLERFLEMEARQTAANRFVTGTHSAGLRF